MSKINVTDAEAPSLWSAPWPTGASTLPNCSSSILAQEPGLIEVIRGIAAMREDVRSTIEAFIALAGDVKSASADLDGRGVLTLASAEAARTAALALYLAAHDADELSRLPH